MNIFLMIHQFVTESKKLSTKTLGFTQAQKYNILTTAILILILSGCQFSPYQKSVTSPPAQQKPILSGSRAIHQVEIQCDQGLMASETSVRIGDLVLPCWTSGIDITHTPEHRINAEQIQDVIWNYITAYFMEYGGVKPRLLGKEHKDSYGHIEFMIEDLQREVITDAHLWEKLQFFITFVVTEENVQIYLILDGWWASGLGTPRNADYKDMEEKYSRELKLYTDEFIYKIAAVLTGDN